MNKTLIAFHVTGGLREIIPIYPLYAVMFGDHGIGAFALSLLFVTWSLTGLVTEVPSGALADRYSRKWLVVAAAFGKSGAFLAWYLWPAFEGYALGFILWGFGSALRSGAFEALLHDTLAAWDRAGEFTRHYGRITALATICIGVGELLGGALIILGYDFVLLISMLVPLVTTIPFVLWVHDVPVEEEVFERDYVTTLKEGLVEALQNRKVSYILLVYALFLIIYGVYDEYGGPFMREKGFGLAAIGYFGALIYAASSLGMLLAERIRTVPLGWLLGTMGASGLALAASAAGEGWLVPLGIALFFFVFAAASTIFAGELQAAILGDSRATVTSAVGFGDSVGAILGFLAFGVVAEAAGMTTATFATAALVVIAGFAFIALAHRWRIDISATG